MGSNSAGEHTVDLKEPSLQEVSTRHPLPIDFHHDHSDMSDDGHSESDRSVKALPRVRSKLSEAPERGVEVERISESAATVRALPTHVLEQLERISSERDESVVNPTAIHMHHHPEAFNDHHSTTSSFLVLPTTGSMIARSASSGFALYSSIPPSPRVTDTDSSALPSPPSSPADSVSSLPSVTSSFFFSSAAASPRMGFDNPIQHEHQHQNTMHDQPPTYRRRRTIRQHPDESSFSSLESSPSSHELLLGLRGHSQSRRGSSWSHRGARSGIGHYSDAAGATAGLVIPSLTLPPALKRPTPFGQTLGDVRLLLLPRRGHAVQGGRGFLASLLLEDNEGVVEVGEWEDPVPKIDDEMGMDLEMMAMARAGAKVLRASTDWLEHTDAHGLEKYEGARNVEVVEMAAYDSASDLTDIIERVRGLVEAPFRTLERVFKPEVGEDSVVANLISGAGTPLFTALILLLPSVMHPLDRHIIDALGALIPIIVLPASSTHNPNLSTTSLLPMSRTSSSSSPISPHIASAQHLVSIPTHDRELGDSPLILSAFRPANVAALKFGLFHSPETVATLRMEAAGRFLRWREVEKAVLGLQAGLTARHTLPDNGGVQYAQQRERRMAGWKGWDKEKWEREWMGDFSRDVVVELREREKRSVDVQCDARSDSPLASERAEYNERHMDIADEDADNEEEDDVLLRQTDYEQEAEHDHATPHIIAYSASQSFDPLHLPSLLVFTVSMLGPLKERLVEMVKSVCAGLMPVAVGRRRTTKPKATRKRSRRHGSSDSSETESEKRAIVVEGVDHRDLESQKQQWILVGGMVGVGFCMGVGVGVVAAKHAD